MISAPFRWLLLACALAASYLTPTVSQGCSVPVFRYALERWERDPYQLVVASNGALTAEQQAWVDALSARSFEEDGFSNVTVHVMDVTDPDNRRDLEVYPVMAQVTEPTVFLLYPQASYLTNVILEEPLTAQTVETVMESDLIESLTLEILSGTSAVWVLIESGDQAADDAAYAVLAETLQIMNEEVELPAGVIETSGNITGGMTEEDVQAHFDPDNYLQSGIPLKVEFTATRLSREHAEPLFRAIVMNMDEAMADYADEPMALPVYGRGRFLMTLIGEEILPQYIGMAMEYISGSCSCQIKADNPGVDLLSHIDWASYLEGSEVVHDKALPPLMSSVDLVETEVTEDVSGVVSDSLDETVESDASIWRTMGIMLFVILGLLIGVSLVIVKKK